MTVTLGFDIYGSVIDTGGVVTALGDVIGEKAQEFSGLWVSKILEYAFRRALMQNYTSHELCVVQALDFACMRFDAQVNQGQKDRLISLFQQLPVFDDVPAELTRLRASGYRLFAFSSGSSKDVDTLLGSAGIRDAFDGVVSTLDVCLMKPQPGAYTYFLRQSGARSGLAWLVSSNPFDIIGAASAGLNTAWVRRSAAAIFDPWDVEPTATVSSFAELAANIEAHRDSQIQPHAVAGTR